MEIKHLHFPGCYLLLPALKPDARGTFLKFFVKEEYLSAGLCTDYAEEYYSESKHGVIRGLHFQIPPFEHTKIVSCLSGLIKDVILDLRVGSPTFNQVDVLEIDSRKGWQLYLPPGIAHGFLTVSEISIVLYRVSSRYSSPHDCGILWSSVPVDWGVEDPVLSARDKTFPRMEEFVSPFIFMPDRVKLV